METLFSILQTVLPIAITILLGVYARRRGAMTADGADGMQAFAIRFALPCVMFNACLTGDFSAETVTSVALMTPLLAAAAILTFRARRRGGVMASHNMPALMATQESGMLGIPLFMVLFGAGQVYRMAALNMAQGFITVPLVAILSAGEGDSLSVGQLAKKVVTSPLLLAMAAGIALNLSGGGAWLESVGLAPVLTSVTEFIAGPISALILFYIGFTFSLSRESLRSILPVCGVHLAVYAGICAVVQGALLLLPQATAETRWAVLLFCLLPSGYIAPGLGRTEEERAMASGVCSLGTVVTLAAFFAMVVILA